MKQLDKTEAIISAMSKQRERDGMIYMERDGAIKHARDLARKLDAIMIAIAPPSFDVSTEYYRGRVDAFSAACDVLDPAHGIDSTGQPFAYDTEPLPLLNPGIHP